MFSTGAWLCAIMVTRGSNPIHSVFYLVCVFFQSSAFLFLIGMEFFALMQLLVYVGALAVMFLFVVMLLDIPVASVVAHQRGSFAISGVFFFIVGTCICIAMLDFEQYVPLSTAQSFGPFPYTCDNTYSWTSLATQKANAAMFGWVFYTLYADLLVLACFILLVAMIGAVVLTHSSIVNVPGSDNWRQQNRDFLISLRKVRTHNKIQQLVP